MRIHQVSRVLGPLALLLAVPVLGTTPASAAPREPQPVTDVQCIEAGGKPKEVSYDGGDFDYTICEGGTFNGKVVIVPDDDDDLILP